MPALEQDTRYYSLEPLVEPMFSFMQNMGLISHTVILNMHYYLD